MLKQFEIIYLGVRAGPFSALTVYACYFFATLFSFGSLRLYDLLWLTLGCSASLNLAALRQR
jgi:hypothetical protein